MPRYMIFLLPIPAPFSEYVSLKGHEHRDTSVLVSLAQRITVAEESLADSMNLDEQYACCTIDTVASVLSTTSVSILAQAPSSASAPVALDFPSTWDRHLDWDASPRIATAPSDAPFRVGGAEFITLQENSASPAQAHHARHQYLFLAGLLVFPFVAIGHRPLFSIMLLSRFGVRFASMQKSMNLS
jgi:hypothetical protein